VQDQEMFLEFLKVYNAIHLAAAQLDYYIGAVSPDTGEWDQLGVTKLMVNGMCKVYLPAMEAMDYGQTVAFYDDAGTTKARLALYGTYLCRGFCSVPNGVAIGDIVEVTLFGRFPPAPAGTYTPGATYYQSGSTAGSLAASGTQKVGFAITDTALFFNPDL